jgi:hypothetical protein
MGNCLERMGHDLFSRHDLRVCLERLSQTYGMAVWVASLQALNRTLEIQISSSSINHSPLFSLWK